jgi:organic hydroperoxide reductase OsmC/OhrA
LCQLQTIGGDPERLFAAGWSASFEGAMAFAARKMRIALPADLARYIESQA